MLFDYLRRKNPIATVILLAFTLLLSQNYLLQHTFEHQAHATEHDSTELCSICVIVQQNNNGLLSTGFSTYLPLNHGYWESVILVPLVFITIHDLLPHPRAPPTTSY